MKNIKAIISFVILILFVINSDAQESATKDFSDKINQYDLSTVWMAENYHGIWLEGEEVRRKPEPLGFIGNEYQRFYIHFISVIKVQNKENEYLVYGKTRVKNNINDFLGIIRISEAKLLTQKYGYQTGEAIGEVILYEDSKQTSTGTITGILRTGFMINTNGNLEYNGIGYISDGFCNNQFKGLWTSYKTGNTKKCHFGDCRIPESNGLDIGAGEFSINDKYIKNGWENYKKSSFAENEEEQKKAVKEEQREWWK